MVYERALRSLLEHEVITSSSKILVVCGGPLDAEIAKSVGLTNVTLTNLNEHPGTHEAGMSTWERQNAEHLHYPDNSFDAVIEHMGLHHCHSPHRALTEMYRVAKRAVVAVENRDSLAVKIAKSLGLPMTTNWNLLALVGLG